MSKQGFVYIMSNETRTTLYTGVTSNLVKRVWEHKQGVGSRFTQKYKLHDLVYYEVCDTIKQAIEREKQIKAGSRAKKDSLITKFNPQRIDLFDSI